MYLPTYPALTPNGVGYGLNIPMVPNRFTNAETSWRRESVWEYEITFEGGLKSYQNWRNDFCDLPQPRTAG